MTIGEILLIRENVMCTAIIFDRLQLMWGRDIEWETHSSSKKPCIFSYSSTIHIKENHITKQYNGWICKKTDNETTTAV